MTSACASRQGFAAERGLCVAHKVRADERIEFSQTDRDSFPVVDDEVFSFCISVFPQDILSMIPSSETCKDSSDMGSRHFSML